MTMAPEATPMSKLLRCGPLILIVGSLLTANCEPIIPAQNTARTADRYQLRLNQYCAERKALENGKPPSDKAPLLRTETFWGWQINSCVEVEVTGGEYWSYDLRDLTNGFFRRPKWVKNQLPLHVYDYTSVARAEGYWEAIE